MASIIQSKLNLVPGAAPGGILPRVRVSQGDAEDRILQFELFDGTTAADMTDVVDCYIGGTKPDGNGFTVSCTLASNVATAVLTDQATVLAGSIRCKLYLLSATGSVRSASFDFEVDPDPLADAGTSDTDITAIVQAAAMYAREAEESAEAAAASEEGAAAAGAAAGQAAAETVVAGKLDKVGGDSKDVVTTFTSQDNAADTGLITTTGQEVSVATMTSGETQSSLFNKVTGLALNLRRTINAVKAIWTGVSDDWDSNGHSYNVYDMVWYGTHLYKCKLAHTSSASITPLNTTYWEDTNVGAELYSLNSNYAKMSISSYSTKAVVKELSTTTDGTYSTRYTTTNNGFYNWYCVYTGSDTECAVKLIKGNSSINVFITRQHDNTMYIETEPIFLLKNTVIEMAIRANGTWSSSIKMHKYS